MLAAPAVATINHLLAQEAWARDALMRHAGKTACIDTGHLALRMRVARDGMLEAAGATMRGRHHPRQAEPTCR
jgi:ubiquinone biosynthesis protein UbiJ